MYRLISATTPGRSMILSTALAFFTAFAVPAMADPQGNYTVSGTNPGNGEPYQGTVTLTRTGETYRLDWNINGAQFVGVGLGAETMPDNSLTIGPSSPKDRILSVGYVADGGFGQGFFVEQADGTWKGIWAFGGGEQIGTEVWQPQ